MGNKTTSVTLTRFNWILINFTQFYIKFNWNYIKMYQFWLDWYCIQLDLIYLIEFETFFFEFIVFVRFLAFLDVVRILYYRHLKFCQFHQIPLLCDHQELACTPKDPPRRVSITQMSFGVFYGNIYWVIDKTVWKPTLMTPICFAGILL